MEILLRPAVIKMSLIDFSSYDLMSWIVQHINVTL